MKTTQMLLGLKTRIVLSIFLILVCVIWLTVFFVYEVLPNPRVAPNFISIWINAFAAVSFVALGLCIAFRAEIRYAVTLYAIAMLWAAGLLVIPVPDGYAPETIYGMYFFVFLGALAFYEKYRRKSSGKHRSKAA